jgi:response regulator RpfG family c-di-GMP phosphodiesterase
LRIKLKLILVVLPILIAFLAIAGMTGSYVTRSAVTRLALRNLAFKTEQLSVYAYNQWKLLEKYGYSNRQEFVRAGERAVASFAEAVIRSGTEVVAALDGEGLVVFAYGIDIPPGSSPSVRSRETGVLSMEWDGASFLGFSRKLDTFGWTILVAEAEDSLYLETRTIVRRILLVILGAGFATTAVLLFLSGALTAPIRRASDAMETVIRDTDLSRRVPVEYDDEIGSLAETFNLMMAELDRSYRRITDIAVREAEARSIVADRERESLRLLGKAADFKDHETGEHIVRVGRYARLFGELLGLDEAACVILYNSAPLHDVGKIGIPDNILLKPGPLDREERRIMESHTVIGHRILSGSRSPFLREGAVIALSHHERWDGTGYPDRLAGEAIPLYARILAVVDVFDALTSERPYKEEWEFDRAADWVEGEGGTAFDPRLAELFRNNRDKIREIYGR